MKLFKTVTYAAGSWNSACGKVSSAGRTSLDIAREEDCEGSHQEVIHMLSSNVRCCSSKALLAQDSQDRPTLKTG